jgi:hypothetical protein
VFRQLADSTHCVTLPRIGIWQECTREIATAFDVTRLEIKTPEAALSECQARIADSWRWHCESLARRGKPVAATPP